MAWTARHRPFRWYAMMGPVEVDNRMGADAGQGDSRPGEVRLGETTAEHAGRPDQAGLAETGQEDATLGTNNRTVRLPKSVRRRQLLAAAQQVFVAQGYHAAAMDDIAERAGVSKPVLYQHFPSKLELYLALLDTHCTEMVTKTRQAMAATTDNKERVRAAMQAYFDLIDHESEAFRLVFESDLRNEPAARELVERAERESIEAIADTIMVDTGVSRHRAELLAAGLVGSAHTAARFWLTTGRSVPKPDAEALLATLAWRGIASFPLQSETEPVSSAPKRSVGTKG
jgi:AcrR family transcriptional regulator